MADTRLGARQRLPRARKPVPEGSAAPSVAVAHHLAALSPPGAVAGPLVRPNLAQPRALCPEGLQRPHCDAREAAPRPTWEQPLPPCAPHAPHPCWRARRRCRRRPAHVHADRKWPLGPPNGPKRPSAEPQRRASETTRRWLRTRRTHRTWQVKREWAWAQGW